MKEMLREAVQELWQGRRCYWPGHCSVALAGRDGLLKESWHERSGQPGYWKSWQEKEQAGQ